MLLAGCSDKSAPAAPALKAVMSADEMAKHHCSGSLEKIKPLHDACAAEQGAGASAKGPNCTALRLGTEKVAELNNKSPGACSPKIRF